MIEITRLLSLSVYIAESHEWRAFTHLRGGLLATQRKRAAFGGDGLAIAIDRSARGSGLVGAQCLELLGAWLERASERAASWRVQNAEWRNQNHHG